MVTARWRRGRILAASVLLLAGAAVSPEMASAAGIQLADVTGEIDPALQDRLDQAAAAYKQLAAADIATAVAGTDKMVAALQGNDLQTARQAWVEVRAAYERCKVLTVKFPYLASGIDPKQSSSVGLRAVAAKLFTPGVPPPLPEAEALSDKLHTFQRVYAGATVYARGVIAGLGIRARQLTEWTGNGVAWDQVAAGQTSINGISVGDLREELQGMELAWNTVFAAIVTEKDKGVADRIAHEFADLKALLGVASFDLMDSRALEAGFQALADSVADAVRVIGWRPPRPEGSED